MSTVASGVSGGTTLRVVRGLSRAPSGRRRYRRAGDSRGEGHQEGGLVPTRSPKKVP